MAFVLSLHPVLNYDLGFHLRTGELVLGSGIPLTDPFSFTAAGTPWFLEQWLGATLFTLVWKGAGIGGVILAKALVVALGFLIVTLVARRASGSADAAVLSGLLAVVVGKERFFAQPFVFSFLLLACTLWVLESWRLSRAPRRLLWLLPLFALWPQIHVGYLYGLAAVAAYGLGTRLARPVLAVGLASGVVAVAGLVAVHPEGFGTLARVWGIFASPFYRATYQEMQALYVAYGLSAALLISWGIPPITWLARRRQIVWPHLWLWLVFVPAAFQVGRLVTEAAIVLVPVSAVCLATVAGIDAVSTSGVLRFCRERLRLVRGAVALFVAALIAVHVGRGFGREWGFIPATYPEACYRWIDQHDVPQRLFNDMMFGGSMIFHFYPRRKVFVDGRTVYSEAFLRSAYLPIKTAAPGFERVMAAWQLEGFLLSPERFAGLHVALQRDPRWSLVYVDDACVLYLGAEAAGRLGVPPQGQAGAP
jgi:hypothetical protein